MLKLELEYFGYLMGKANSLEKTLLLGKIEGRRRRGRQRMVASLTQWHHQLNGHEFEQALGVGGEQGSPEYCNPWSHKESDMTEQLK